MKFQLLIAACVFALSTVISAIDAQAQAVITPHGEVAIRTGDAHRPYLPAPRSWTGSTPHAPVLVPHFVYVPGPAVPQPAARKVPPSPRPAPLKIATPPKGSKYGYGIYSRFQFNRSTIPRPGATNYKRSRSIPIGR